MELYGIFFRSDVRKSDLKTCKNRDVSDGGIMGKERETLGKRRRERGVKGVGWRERMRSLHCVRAVQSRRLK
jgi:hypothetical protein